MGRPEHNDLLEDALKNTQMIVHWSNDPDTTRSQYGAGALWRLWLRERGIKQIFIDPFCNYTAVIHGEKWIPIRPNTGAALAMSLIEGAVKLFNEMATFGEAGVSEAES